MCVGALPRSTLMAPPKSQAAQPPTPPSTLEPTVAAPSPMATPEKPPALSQPAKVAETSEKLAKKPSVIGFGTVSASAETLVLGASFQSLPSVETLSSKPSFETSHNTD